MTVIELEPEPLERLTRDEEKGWILEDGIRIISFRLRTIHAAVDKLASMVGSKVTATLLYEIGFEIGKAAMSYSRDNIHSEEELGPVLDRVLSLRGWGRCLGIAKRPLSGGRVYVARLKGTLLSDERQTVEPTCHMVRGVVAGWLETHCGKKAVESVETECVSTGDPACVFEVKLN